MENKIIEFKNVTFGYTSNIKNIDNVSFTINHGEYICIIGHNGSGKSTMSKLLGGILIAQSGSILVNGLQINSDNILNIRRSLGTIFQNPDNQFVGITVRDDIAFGLENYKVPQKKMDDVIDLVAKSVGMSDFVNDAPHTLSGGQKQRVAIASSIATNPDILIFDESTAMLDPLSKNNLKDLMYLLKKKYKKTIISITHDMEEVTRADRVIVMSGGKVLKIGTPQEIFENRDFLLNIKLDSPFISRFCIEMQKYNKDFPLSFDENKIVDYICKQK
ncbi:MAG: energy-coupling factor transporter ATPase [Mycoplasmataceae bacterium]|jgi:energy-coupling factor transport system ATP-binding protein|nr:energy-coupling factor transporter ATPase [Mycoplasmataceae bacterium]